MPPSAPYHNPRHYDLDDELINQASNAGVDNFYYSQMTGPFVYSFYFPTFVASLTLPFATKVRVATFLPYLFDP